MAKLRLVLLISLAMLLGGPPGSLQAETAPGWLSDAVVKALFPQALYTGPIEGDPPAAEVHSAGTKIGYIFASSEMTDTIGFSGAPFTIAIGVDTNGVMAGVQVVEHAEPIIAYNTRSEPLVRFVKQYLGLDYGNTVRVSGSGQQGDIDGISSATISARAFHSAIMQSARLVARSRGLIGGAALSTSVDNLHYEPMSWQQLADSGAVKRLQVNPADIDQSEHRDAGGALIDLHVALATPTSIGRNLLGRARHANHVARHSTRDLVILLMASGSYSFVGKQVFNSGTFDRVRIVQNESEYRLPRELNRYTYLPFIRSEGAPDFTEVGLFRLPADTGIDVLAPWKLVLTVRDDAAPAGAGKDFELPYALPAQFILQPSEPGHSADEAPAWQAVWHAQAGNIAVLTAALVTLTVVLVLMVPLTRRPRLYQWVRNGFLLFTLVWIGWIAGAQLSVINPLTWMRAVGSSQGWGVLLADPLLCVLLIFILVSFVAWGRGVFCGWLCPFGALQELLARTARLLRVPQVAPSHRTHQLLWPLKYVVLAALVVAALHAPTTLGTAAEVEPFKTVISLRFDRSWPFVLYAVALLIVGLFIERAFCRFACPLGAVMALGGKLRLFTPLKRRDDCGSPCQLCARRCPIQAVEPSGAINMDECFYCLDCQVIYQDAKVCPPLVVQARRAALPGMVNSSALT